MLLAFWRPWRGGAVSTAQLRLLLIYGVNLGLMNLLYYLALQRLPLGLAVAIEFIGPFSLALFHSRRPADLLWLGFAVAGLLLLLPWGAGSLAVDPLGAAYALVAGAAWACYIVFGQKAGALLPSGRVVAIGTVIAAGVTLPIGWATAGSALWGPGVLAVGLVVALFSSAIPYSFDMIAMKRLPTRTFGIMMSVEPAIAALSGFLVLGEQLTLRQQIAIACVVVASFGSTASSGTVVAAPEL
jgi:inner membrane transporter RhtA